MLYPRVQSVSSKGQVVLSADVRRALVIGRYVLITPNLQTGEVTIAPISGDDPIEAGLGMFSRGRSLTKALLEEKKVEKKLEERKYGKLRSR